MPGFILNPVLRVLEKPGRAEVARLGGEDCIASCAADGERNTTNLNRAIGANIACVGLGTFQFRAKRLWNIGLNGEFQLIEAGM
jgi:hypothetical protein